MKEVGNVVQFSTRRRPFLVNDMYCNSLDCCCNEVVLCFTEINDAGRSLKNGLSFSVRVDLGTWQENEPPPRPPEVTACVQEFLEQCPATRRAEYQAGYANTKQFARRIAEYRLDRQDVLEGVLLSYADVQSDRSALSSGGQAYTFDVHFQGRRFLVEDRYCPNPDCDCRKVYLEFFEVMDADSDGCRIVQRFLGTVSLTGRLTVEKRVGLAGAEADAVLSAWWSNCQADLTMLKIRYQDVKEIGRRSVDAQPARSASLNVPGRFSDGEVSVDNRLTAEIHVGRNDPCPCGSGKKFKKCCWRKTEQEQTL